MQHEGEILAKFPCRQSMTAGTSMAQCAVYTFSITPVLVSHPVIDIIGITYNILGLK